MPKIKFILENPQVGKESFEADGVVYTLFRVDPQTKQPQFMIATGGKVKDGIVLANMLAATRNYVMKVLGVKEDQEDLFDKIIRDTADEIRNKQNSLSSRNKDNENVPDTDNEIQ
ncbi:hypothetical protein P8864_00630 [Priestia flexa]|uniref:hypothetical protein n=1 Tax=Priestia flexa TaxID=86664 RepID=UPI000C2424D9|nr:hypothetical protein [Priestia flexa]MEC0664465.1 hypothetical protein [Priestia flexa]MED3824662.1 hypothetical protein [Priestia flexa]